MSDLSQCFSVSLCKCSVGEMEGGRVPSSFGGEGDQQMAPMGDARKGTHLMKSPLGSVRLPKPTGQ